MPSPTLLDGKTKMAKKVIKAAEADKKVEEITKPKKKNRSAKEVRSKLYGKDA